MPRTPRHIAVLLAIAVAWPALAYGQAKDAFVRGLVDVITAAGGTFGDEGPALTNAIDDMAAGLGQWDAAISRAEAGLATDIGQASPSMAARMRAALGTIYLERGRIDDALTQFALAEKLDARFVDVYVLRATALEFAGRSQEVPATYRAAWNLDRDNPVIAYLWLRTTGEAAAQETQAASQVLTHAVEQRASAAERSAPTRFLTVGLLDDTSVPDPAFPPAAYVSAFELLRRGRFDAAVAGLRQAAAVDPLVTDPALRSPDVRRAAARIRQDQASTAIPDLVTAEDRYPMSAEIHRLLGTAYWSVRQYDRSLEQLREAVRLNPADERARIAVADVLAASGDIAGARSAMAEVVQAIPGSGQALWKLGRLHQELGDGANALRAFEAAAERLPYAGAGQLFKVIGELKHGAVDLDAASTAYERRVELDPNDTAAHADLCDVYLAQDRFPEATREALVAALLDPTSARAFATLGQLRADAGDDQGAVLMLQKAVGLDADHLEARYALARALLRLGRADEGQAQLKIFADLQAKSMDEQRQRFRENERKIEEALSGAQGEKPR